MRISDWSSDVCSSDLRPSRVEFRSSVKWHILHCRNCLLLPRRGNSLPIHNHWKAVLLTIMSKLNHSPAAPMGLFLSSTFIRIEQIHGESANMIAHILTLQRQGEVRLDITRFGSAIEAAAIKGDAMKRLNANKRCDGVGQLNFATRTFFLIFQYAHHLWLKDKIGRAQV